MRLSYIAVLVGLLGVSGFSQTVLVQPYLQPGGDSPLAEPDRARRSSQPQSRLRETR